MTERSIRKSLRIARLVIMALLLMAMLLPAATAVGQSVVATVPVGTNPQGVAVNPLTYRIYVANEGSNDVSVIDDVANVVIATIPVGTGPHAVDVNPSTNLVYVANLESNDVSVIDGASNSVVSTIPVGTRPVAVAVNPATNRIYVGNGESNDVSVIDGATNAVIDTLSFASGPGSIAVNAETNRIYVITFGFQGVTSVIDGDTNAVITTLETGSNAADLAVNPATNRLYVTSSMAGTVSVYDTSTNGLVTSVTVAGPPSGTFGVAVNTAANRVYVTSFSEGTNSLAVIDGANNSIVATLTAGGGGEVDVNPRNGLVFLPNGQANTVDIVQDDVPLPPLRVSATVSSEGDTDKVDISVKNNTGGTLTQMEIRGTIPEGATLADVSPPSFQVIGDQVVWISTEQIGPGQTISGFQYDFSGGTGTPIVTVDFIGQTRGSVSTGSSLLTRHE